MSKTTLAPGQLLEKSCLCKAGYQSCTTSNLPLEVAPRQRKTYVNSYRRQTVHQDKVGSGVSELPWGNEVLRIM